MILGDTCAECGGPDAGRRQLCAKCEPLYPISDVAPAPGADFPPVDDGCDCMSCRSDMAKIHPCLKGKANG